MRKLFVCIYNIYIYIQLCFSMMSADLPTMSLLIHLGTACTAWARTAELTFSWHPRFKRDIHHLLMQCIWQHTLQAVRFVLLNHIPFIIWSKCSQSISPTKSGASSRKLSFPRSQSSWPFMSNLKKFTFVRLNSVEAQCNHFMTCCLLHLCGSINAQNKKIVTSRVTSI